MLVCKVDLSLKRDRKVSDKQDESSFQHLRLKVRSNGYKNGNIEVQELTSDWMGSDQCGKAAFSKDVDISMVSKV